MSADHRRKRLSANLPGLMLLVDSERISHVTGSITIRHKDWVAPSPSPTIDIDRALVFEAVEAGANMLQVRLNAQELVIAVALAQTIARPTTLLFVRMPVADAAGRLAVELGGHVHLPEKPVEEARTSISALRAGRNGDALIVSCAVHSVDAAIQAQELGADLVVAGTVFNSASHPGGATLGLSGLRDVCESVTIPVLGIGGITDANAADAIRAGAAGVAVIGAIMDAPDPSAAARALRAAIDQAWAAR